MSNIAAGIPIGMAIGIGSGMSIGIAAGKNAGIQETAAKIRELAATHRIEVTTPEGLHLSVDEFIHAVMPAHVSSADPKRKRIKSIILIVLGLLGLALGLLFLFFKIRSS